MLRILPLLALSVLLALVVFSGCDEAVTVPEVGQVRGSIKRIYSQLPVAGAVVSMGGETATTNADGSFGLSSVPQGDGVLVVTSDEYRELRRPISVERYQYFNLEMMPLDSLVSIVGRVRHRVDGAVSCVVDIAGNQIATDSEGNWSLEEVGLGPLSLTIDREPYNPYTIEILVHSEGQSFDQLVTRDTLLTWMVEHDSYVFTKDDSLNANRGATPWIHVTEDLGRTAYFAIDHPEFPFPWATLTEGWLDLHGFLKQNSHEPVGLPATVEFEVGVLDALFSEMSVDFINRPNQYRVGSMSMVLDEDPLNQPFSLNLMQIFTNAPFNGAWGVSLSTDIDQLPLIILSSEWETEPDRPTVRLMYHF